MIQIYDLRRDVEYIQLVQKATVETKDFGLIPEHGLFGSAEWWEAVKRGRIPVRTITGKVSRVYLSGHNDYEEFEIDDGHAKTSWTRTTSETDNVSLTRVEKASLYQVGAPVRLTYVMQKPKKQIGLGPEHKCVVGIWLGGGLTSA